MSVVTVPADSHLSSRNAAGDGQRVTPCATSTLRELAFRVGGPSRAGFCCGAAYISRRRDGLNLDFVDGKGGRASRAGPISSRRFYHGDFTLADGRPT
jgi:hypothetical protein